MTDRLSGQSFATRSEILASNGLAATSQPLATQVAIEILRKGGTAVDAAIAANALLGLVEPTGCGLGGDLFAIVWDSKTKKLHGLNGSGRAPRSLGLEHLRSLRLDKIPSAGPLPISVPGAVDGWFALHSRFGKLSFSDLLEPTIAYAHQGFPVSQIIADTWASEVSRLRDFPGFAKTFMPRGRAPRKGEIFENHALAETLETIAAEGRDAFYDGAIAEAVDRFMERVGGFLTREDLAAHASEWVEPVGTSYRGCDVWELPPNSQGIAALQMLNLLEGFDLAGMGFGSADYLHHVAECKKLAFEDRAKYYADPAFADVPVERLVSKDYAAERRELIDPRSAMQEAPAGDPVLRTGDTVYLTTADAEGNMVSLIQSNFRGMGSGLCPDGLGFCLQNRGELFSLAEEHPNCYAPGKRPFHTIIPAFVTREGRPLLSFGVMGGDAQPQMHVQILANWIDFGMNLQEAGDAPRILHTGSSEPTGGDRMVDGGALHLESGYGAEIRRELCERGHRVIDVRGGFGGYQAIGVDPETGVYCGASESRKDGQAAGY